MASSADKPKKKVMTIDTVDRQRRYVDAQKKKGHGLGVVFADAFLRGMRDLGYKNPAWALAEELDNAFQADANVVAIRFGFEPGNKTRVKPDVVAVCDNGNGMIPEMISYAVRWGGTDREGDRTGLGRYGYGLPSSVVSLAKRYTVYSKVSGGDWHAVTVDIDRLAAAAGDVKETEALLEPREAKLPAWVTKAGKGDDGIDLSALKSGTVIVLEELDRLKRLSGWIKVDTLRTKLLQHFGVIYRHWIPERRVLVDGMQAQAVDPLFLMEHGRFFSETPVRARRVEARTFEVETARGTTGSVSIRASVLPPHFQLADPNQYGHKGAKTNNRLGIMKDYNGLIICRGGRQIDCVSPRWTKFQNYDAHIKIEINFDPELDEYFGITTAKQQIVLDDDMWEKLQQGGKSCGALAHLVEDMRRAFTKLQDATRAKFENRAAKDGPRPSAMAMEQSEMFKGAVPEPTPAQRLEAKRNIEDLAARREEVTGRPREKVIEELLEETSKRRWEVEFEPIPEGPFFRPMRLGEQKRLIINTNHPFYTKVYSATAPEVRAAIEVLLLVLAERELEVMAEAETFYRAERQRWSERLRHALASLVPDETLMNIAAAVAESLHASADVAPGAE
ncbi:MAG TPA: ATP-binding protein [Polyangiaceae bacterium]|nr:ATP-binding protein [Polyangiaceae bacterium]